MALVILKDTWPQSVFALIPLGVEWELSIFFDVGGYISRVSAKK